MGESSTIFVEKETRDLDYDGFDPQEVLEQVYNTLVAKYSLTDDMDNNKKIFEENGYIFGEDIIGSTLMGEFVHTSALADAQEERFITTRHHVNTHTDGMNLRHAIDAIKTAVGVSYDVVATILRRLFRASRYRSYCLLSLSNKEWWAFVINNYRLLRQEFVDVTAIMNEQTELPLAPHMSEFYIPIEDFFHYDPDVKDEVEFLSNAYENYTSGFVTTRVRGSICEVLFEQYCESLNTVDWVYKNGDSGQQYFSVVFIDNLHTQKLFYPDYIVKMQDETIWLIETKGGEGSEGDKNIDPQIGNKFNALKRYAEKHGLNWGFVRDKDNQLYINNTEFVEDMSDDRWVSLRNIL